jgi:Fur family transcriptional regulator, ferric uptake regulator
MRIAIIVRMRWAEHAQLVLRGAGFKPGAARTAVIDVLEAQSCCLPPTRIYELVRAERPGVGIASVYRALDVLTELGLVHRLELGGSSAQYEPAARSGDHHHHLVCGDCGKVEAFSDDRLEVVIETVSQTAAFRIDDHDVVLRGRCDGCAA